MSPWALGTALYLVLGAAGFLPVAIALLRPVRVDGSAPGFFDTSPHFSENARQLLGEHDRRMRGALEFWKREAAKYRRLHAFAVAWTISSAVLVAVLATVSDGSTGARAMIAVVAAITAVLVALDGAFRADERHRGFRQGESTFYDLRRRMVDSPGVFGATEEQQLAAYFGATEVARRFVRTIETGTVPTVGEVHASLWPGSDPGQLAADTCGRHAD